LTCPSHSSQTQRSPKSGFGGAGAGGSIESMALRDRRSLDRRPGDRSNVGTAVRAHRPMLATATDSVPRPRSITRPPPARRRPMRRARRGRPVGGGARVSGRRSSPLPRQWAPAASRVRDPSPSSPRRPGPHPTTGSGRMQRESCVRSCVRFAGGNGSPRQVEWKSPFRNDDESLQCPSLSMAHERPGRSGPDWPRGRWEWSPPVEGLHSMIERDP